MATIRLVQMSSATGNIGPSMIGSYLNVVLYTLELVEVYIYYFASPRSLKDPVFLKCCVATSLVSDTVGTMGVCALIFVTTLAFTDTLTADKLYWGFQVYIVSNMISAFIFQSYMVHRYWKLSRNYFVSFFISLLILASLATTIRVVADDLDLVRRLFGSTTVHVHERWIIVVLVTAMLTDVSITIALIWHLHLSGAHGGMSLQTKRLIARISSQAIKTGVFPCLIAFLTMVTYVGYKNQNIANCFSYMMGRVYTLTMLFSLIYRDKLRLGGEWVNRVAATTDSEHAMPPIREGFSRKSISLQESSLATSSSHTES